MLQGLFEGIEFASGFGPQLEVQNSEIGMGLRSIDDLQTLLESDNTFLVALCLELLETQTKLVVVAGDL